MNRLETLSEFVHEEMWSKWAKILLDEEHGISDERRKRWEECFIPYNQLSEDMKDLDRGFAKRILNIIDPVKEPTYRSVLVRDCEELGLKHNWCHQHQMPRYCSVCGKED